MVRHVSVRYLVTFCLLLICSGGIQTLRARDIDLESSPASREEAGPGEESAQVPGLGCGAEELRAADALPQAEFGISLSATEEIVVVGAPGDSTRGPRTGAAYVFRRAGATWVEEAKLLAPDGKPAQSFGIDVAASDQVIAIGAPGDDENGHSSGAAYVFRFDGDDWQFEQKLVASDGESNEVFGEHIAVSKDVILAGAQFDDPTGFHSGSAYVFRFDGTRWKEEQKLFASDGATLDTFGREVAVFGRTILVASPLKDAVGINSGAVYLFRFDGSRWREQEIWIPSAARSGDQFGLSVSLGDGVAVVGSPFADLSGADSGSAHVYRLGGSMWSEEQLLVPHRGEEGEIFGTRVSVLGEFVAIGAPLDDDIQRNAGSVHLFRFDGIRWREVTELWDCDAGEGHRGGTGLALTSDSVWMGAPGSDAGGVSSGVLHHFSSACPNRRPCCRAGRDIEAGCDGVDLEGARALDPEWGALSFSWTSDCGGVFDPPGSLNPTVTVGDSCSVSCILSLSVEDESGNLCNSSRSLVIEDLAPPRLEVPHSLRLECTQPGGVPATAPVIQDWLASARAVDLCAGDVDTQSNPPDFFPFGCGAPGAATTVVFRAEDPCGNAVEGESEVIVADTQPPQVDFQVMQECLWPPNHRMVEVGSYLAVDACDPSPKVLEVSVSSDEDPAHAPGAGGLVHCPDFAMRSLTDAAGSVQVRAERSGAGNGRVYGEARIRARDHCGLETDASFRSSSVPPSGCPGLICVPHHRTPQPGGYGNGPAPSLACHAVDDGQIHWSADCAH